MSKMAELAGMVHETQERVERLKGKLVNPAMLGHNTLIALTPGLYLGRDSKSDEWTVCGFERASYFEPWVAATACENGDIHDGAGNLGRPVNWLQAVRDEIKRDEDMLSWLNQKLTT